MERKYNYIYRLLVKDSNDLIGLIAYGLYKQHKIEFIENYRNDHEGNEPTEEDCKAFALTTSTARSIAQYRDAATALLQKITIETTSAELEEYERTMLRNYKTSLREIVKSESPKWWQSVLWSVLGAFIFSVIVAVAFYLGSTTERNSVEIGSRVIELVQPSPSLSSDSVLNK